MHGWTARLLRGLAVNAVIVAAMAIVPHRWCAWQARPWLRGDGAAEARLARGVEADIAHGLPRGAFNTGSELFDGEWQFGTYMMAGVGYGQYALRHPAERERCAGLMTQCIERILSDEVRAFDRRMWKDDPIDTLEGGRGHAAYLGYFNLLLGLHVRIDSNSAYAALNDRISTALAGRLEASPILLLESYPGETYPVDNCAVIGSLGLHSRRTGGAHDDLLRRWVDTCRARYVGKQTGLLIQAVDTRTGKPLDLPRGSGTALGLFFLSFADARLSEELYRAACRELGGSFLGFGGVREYARGTTGEHGDIDSGPIVMGFGLSATGFLIAGTRMFDDDRTFTRLYATAHLCGAPLERGGRLNFVTGGPLGDAILFAMLTARDPREGYP
jgi:hypothetical protein